jgi:hypothetical protein
LSLTNQSAEDYNPKPATKKIVRLLKILMKLSANQWQGYKQVKLIAITLILITICNSQKEYL